ncbi:hypothetical protein M413DRAFT_274239 [Hebeloma cylindrosporum]|uniref:Uncharacterized protein n=1 Tax=Hebeloma cylindrosporum TaxID=76867 RepID=A0A0C2Y8Q9_HEBCY|nr:hypothetical protein M413DRAFT_274239 [Hebeloma cylindrosporum h7]
MHKRPTRAGHARFSSAIWFGDHCGTEYMTMSVQRSIRPTVLEICRELTPFPFRG